MATPIDLDGDIYGEPISNVDFRPHLPRTRWGWKRLMRKMTREQILVESVREEKSMAHTGHGHHIPGTTGEGSIPRGDVTKCGGVGICPRCKIEAETFMTPEQVKEAAVAFGRKCQDLENNCLWDEYKAAREEWTLFFLGVTDADLKQRAFELYWIERDRGLTGE
jgi:hypothetical protein